MRKMFWAIFMISFNFFLALTQYTCTSDLACVDCQFYLITTGFGLFGYYYCGQCSINYSVNQVSGVCQCNNGYFPSSAAQCSKCPQICTSCTSGTSCTSCNLSYNRFMQNGQCVCIEDYQSKNGNAMCTKKANVLMIVLSSVGSLVFCGLLGFIFYRCCAVRVRNQHKIHDFNSHHIPRNAQQVQIYMEADSTYMHNSSTPASFWNAKQYEFKPDEICSICLDPKPLFITDCGHYFHAKCIYSWLQSRPHCPNCNKQTSTRALKRWCSRCNKTLLPVIVNVSIKKTGKSKRQLIKSTPIQNQLCDQCQNTAQSMQADTKQMFN